MKTQIYLFILFSIWGFWSCSGSEENVYPEVTDISESVYASVTIEPAEMYNVYSKVPGILDTLWVEEGDTVKAGQVIAQIVAQHPELTAAQARLNVELAQQKYQGKANLLATIESEIQTAQKQFLLDSLNFVRQKSLWEQNIGSQVEFDQRKLQYERSANGLAAIRQKYSQTKTELDNAYRSAQNALAQANINLADYSITSKIDGKVYAINKEPGELVMQQEPLAQIGHADIFLIDMAIDEVDVASIETGQQAVITLDAYPDKSYLATVTKIYPLKNNRTQTFKIEAEFTAPPPTLYAGMAGEANILISEKKNALTVPVEYVTDQYVHTANGKIKVKTGIRTMERVEILSGIDSTQALKKP
jgi:multidrug efflux pump subunit AcrA (membrane-fusion protein)